jgi:CxxC-x17-CxxC domain-containing protein
LRISVLQPRNPFGPEEELKVEFTDRTLTCIECGEEFLFSAGEQRFFALKSLVNEPRRCKNCKIQRNLGLRESRAQGGGFVKHETLATCSQCGKQTTLPFRPTQGRPVFCRDCFQHRKMAAMA